MMQWRIDARTICTRCFTDTEHRIPPHKHTLASNANQRYFTWFYAKSLHCIIITTYSIHSLKSRWLECSSSSVWLSSGWEIQWNINTEMQLRNYNRKRWAKTECHMKKCISGNLHLFFRDKSISFIVVLNKSFPQNSISRRNGDGSEKASIGELTQRERNEKVQVISIQK